MPGPFKGRLPMHMLSQLCCRHRRPAAVLLWALRQPMAGCLTVLAVAAPGHGAQEILHAQSSASGMAARRRCTQRLRRWNAMDARSTCRYCSSCASVGRWSHTSLARREATANARASSCACPCQKSTRPVSSRSRFIDNRLPKTLLCGEDRDIRAQIEQGLRSLTAKTAAHDCACTRGRTLSFFVASPCSLYTMRWLPLAITGTQNAFVLWVSTRRHTVSVQSLCVDGPFRALTPHGMAGIWCRRLQTSTSQVFACRASTGIANMLRKRVPWNR